MKPPDDKRPGDYAHAAGKMALGLVPYVGGPLAELFASVFATPLDRRRQEWLRGLGALIEDLCSRVDNMTPEKLSQNNEFISACQHASSIAMRSHQQEKLAALRTALKNVVVMDVGDIKSSMFIRLVDEFSVLHLRILEMCHRAECYRQQLQAKTPKTFTEYPSIGSIWDACGFQPRSDDPLLQLAERDLVARGLSYADAMRSRPRGDSKLSELGKEFLAFISEEPPADQAEQ
jgi:hypothetical protein